MKLLSAAVLVVVLAVASAGAWVYLVRDDNSNDGEAWWEPLLAFAPPEAAGGSVILSNAEQIYAKEGLPAPAVCKFEPISIRTEAESRAESSTRQFYQALYVPEAGLGFDACQVRRYLGLGYGSPEIELQVFDAGVSGDDVTTSLLAAGYEKEVTAGLAVYFAPPRDDEAIEVALGIFDSIQYATVVEEFVVTSNDKERWSERCRRRETRERSPKKRNC